MSKGEQMLLNIFIECVDKHSQTGTLKKINANASGSCLWDTYMYIYEYIYIQQFLLYLYFKTQF